MTEQVIGLHGLGAELSQHALVVVFLSFLLAQGLVVPTLWALSPHGERIERP